MRVAIVPSTDLDSKDLRASRYVPKAPQRDSHTFTVIVGEDDEARWEWCIRCGALRLYGEHMYPGPRQAMTIKGTMKTRRCAADKAPTWRRSGDYHYYGRWTVIGPRDGVYRVNGQEFTKLKNAKAFVEGGCRRSSIKKKKS